MCLGKVTTHEKLKSDGNGYKIFHKSKTGNLYFSYSTIGKQVPLPTGKWMDEKRYRKNHNKNRETISCFYLGGFREYPMGFHVYLNKKLAKQRVFSLCQEVLIPVKFRKAHTKGKQGDLNVIVAKEIFIQREV